MESYSKSVMCLIAFWIISVTYVMCQMPTSAEVTQTSNLWQYQPNSASPNGSPYGPTHNDYTMGQRQTALASPLVSFLPMLVLFGIGAVIVISILYFIFNPFGLTSLLGPGLAGSPTYGRKRSIDGSKFQQYLMELISTVSSAIDKYEKFESSASQTSTPSKATPPKATPTKSS